MTLKIKNLRIQPMFRWYDLYIGLYIDPKHWQFYFVFFGLVLKIWQEKDVDRYIEQLIKIKLDHKEYFIPDAFGKMGRNTEDIRVAFVSFSGIDEDGRMILRTVYEEKDELSDDK